MGNTWLSFYQLPLLQRKSESVMTGPYVVVSTVQGLRTTHGISVAGLGFVEVLVPREMADDARELLAQADRGELTLADEE